MNPATDGSVDRSRGLALGLVNGDVPRDPAEFTRELANSWRARGIGCLAVAFVRPAAELSLESMRELRVLLEDAGVRVSQFSGVNANLVHPDQAARDEAVRRVRAAIGPATALGARLIISGTGSCSPTWRDYFYRPDVENFSAAAEDRAVDTLTRVAELIDGTDLLYAVECHQLTTMRSAPVIRRVLDRVGHPKIRANFDPINLLDSAYAVYASAERVSEMVDIVGPRYAPTCHVKDIAVGDEMPLHTREVPPGRGLVDIDTIINAALRLPGEGPVDFIIEHLSADESVAAVEFVRQRVVTTGIALH